MNLKVSLAGRAVARSGLLPSTANEILAYLDTNREQLASLADACASSELDDVDDFAFVLIHAAYSCTEYGRGSVTRRFLPYQLLAAPLSGPQARVRRLLFAPSENDALNAAILAWRWIRGVEMRQLESALDIRSGVLTGMFGDAAGIIKGMADVLYASTSTKSVDELPSSVAPEAVESLRSLVAAIRQVAARLDAGLPDDVIWMRELAASSNIPSAGNRAKLLSRQQIISLRTRGFYSPSELLDPGRFPQLLDAMGPRNQTNRALAEQVQVATRDWRVAERNRLVENQKRRLPVECRDLLLKFYRARETEFEEALSEVFGCFGITIDARDDGSINAFPDFIISPQPPQVLAIECKSKTVGDSVTLNDASEVLRKASLNGYSTAFKITVCQPYVSPDVPRKINNCSELCVVNAEDLAEAFVRLKTGKLDLEALVDWMSRPGQALRENLISINSVATGIS